MGVTNHQQGESAMADARVIVPRGHFSHIFNHGRSTPRNLQYRLVHYGFWSTGVLLLLMPFDLIWPSLFASHYVAIGMIYLCFQLVEAASRNPLKQGEVFESIFFACIPTLISLFMLFLHWRAQRVMFTPDGWWTMAFWFVCSLIGLVNGAVMAVVVLETPFRRSDSVAPRT
jgi:hypothetical protein